MDELQLYLIASVMLLAVLSGISGVYAYYQLREIGKALEKNPQLAQIAEKAMTDLQFYCTLGAAVILVLSGIGAYGYYQLRELGKALRHL